MRCKILVVPTELVMPDFGRGGKRSYLAGAVDFTNLPFANCEGMPADARIIDIRFGTLTDGVLEITIESDTFPDAQPPYERIGAGMTTHASYQAYLKGN